MFKTQNNDRPSLQIINALYEHDDFMESIRTMVDLGCGSGEDLAWWASATTREDRPRPLNIQCVGVDVLPELPIARKYPNASYQLTDFEHNILAPPHLFDVLWCHDAFQYCINPLATLAKWKNIASPGAMLIIAVPQTQKVVHRQMAVHLPPKVYYHHSLVSMIYMLSVNGWDCRNGFFQQLPGDDWIRCVVYHTDQTSRDPKTTTWYDLVDSGLLPESADRSVMAHGHLRQQDLIIPWLDHNLTWMGKQ